MSVAPGALYAAAVFALGFLMGTIRVLFLVPMVGAVAAVLIELPVMLGLSAWVARRIVALRAVPATVPARAGMGLVAFGVLMTLEISLGLFGFGQELREIGAAMLRPEGLIGLAGQIAFAAMPVALLGPPFRT